MGMFGDPPLVPLPYTRFGRPVALLMLALAVSIGPRAPTAATAAVQAWRIDEARTSIVFTINAAGYPTTRGHFRHFSGRIVIDFEHPAKSFTNFTVQAESIDAGSPAFDDFIKSALLLNAEKFPTLSFTSTHVEKVDARIARITGDLTMLGVTKPITLTVNVDPEGSAKGRAVAFVATGTIVRSQFGMIFGIPLIDDALGITVKTRALSDE
jgi:polyisoprenoid-binding protein YceI